MTKHYITSDTLNVGDYTEYKGDIYIAEKAPKGKPCITKCQALRGDRCTGVCLRFRNFKDFVLKKARPYEDCITIVETQFAKSCREMMERLKAPLPTEQKKGE